MTTPRSQELQTVADIRSRHNSCGFIATILPQLQKHGLGLINLLEAEVRSESGTTINASVSSKAQ